MGVSSWRIGYSCVYVSAKTQMLQDDGEMHIGTVMKPTVYLTHKGTIFLNEQCYMNKYILAQS